MKHKTEIRKECTLDKSENEFDFKQRVEAVINLVGDKFPDMDGHDFTYVLGFAFVSSASAMFHGAETKDEAKEYGGRLMLNVIESFNNSFNERWGEPLMSMVSGPEMPDGNVEATVGVEVDTDAGEVH